ncbi:hypothetical protein MPNB_6760 [Mycoplasmoides pneumoniae]|uniref:Secreted protein n=1 Tax=Mycoplasmoides pneumoniae 309 TaxID=1112856 RepID=A0AB33HR41_MYCPM|nr:hypothetical protein MPNA6760 [Mycoplasmoides pneumoniae 309]BAV20189.1 hypothetical protein MPNB_6760 [Mycoplasmoides pneumoniae]BAV20931.1 hypothetical protein MPNC_6760 [Mycoplasmoides pneumoniae]
MAWRLWSTTLKVSLTSTLKSLNSASMFANLRSTMTLYSSNSFRVTYYVFGFFTFRCQRSLIITSKVPSGNGIQFDFNSRTSHWLLNFLYSLSEYHLLFKVKTPFLT